MINQQLLDFIKQQLQKGVSKDIISRQLLDNGWTEEDIKQGFGAVGNSVIGFNVPTSSVSNFKIKEKSHVGKKIFLIVLGLFLLAGGVSAYFYKNDLMKLPVIIKNFSVSILSNIKI